MITTFEKKGILIITNIASFVFDKNSIQVIDKPKTMGKIVLKWKNGNNGLQFFKDENNKFWIHDNYFIELRFNGIDSSKVKEIYKNSFKKVLYVWNGQVLSTVQESANNLHIKDLAGQKYDDNYYIQFDTVKRDLVMGIYNKIFYNNLSGDD